jgi:hypothetical protein
MRPKRSVPVIKKRIGTPKTPRHSYNLVPSMSGTVEQPGGSTRGFALSDRPEVKAVRSRKL